ncbi:hypothetical protein EOD42_14110 [Rhodovarius crocodyli]|uniref:Uncharacterized protein n=1 Tax=Rhodovarius crocodyli TaxID=1979269 RepID=A0A437MF44_9PROT|nr:hypothetical protein [Rhodovarius crocodyli]RVT96242.1 hypothetical protein EOD42_14110 [Rhodovarius crocodyli]
MIVMIKSYFREGRWSFYEGETFHAEAMCDERGIAMDDFQKHVALGEVEVTEDNDPAADPLADDVLLAVAGAAIPGVAPERDEGAEQPLAEDAPPSTMTE